MCVSAVGLVSDTRSQQATVPQCGNVDATDAKGGRRHCLHMASICLQHCLLVAQQRSLRFVRNGNKSQGNTGLASCTRNQRHEATAQQVGWVGICLPQRIDAPPASVTLCTPGTAHPKLAPTSAAHKQAVSGLQLDIPPLPLPLPVS